jgi:hypothetical protein
VARSPRRPPETPRRPADSSFRGRVLRRVTTHDSRQRDLVAELSIGILQSASLAAEWDADMH